MCTFKDWGTVSYVPPKDWEYGMCCCAVLCSARDQTELLACELEASNPPTGLYPQPSIFLLKKMCACECACAYVFLCIRVCVVKSSWTEIRHHTIGQRQKLLGVSDLQVIELTSHHR